MDAVLDRVDYQDDFAAPTLERTPPDAITWTREIFEGAPRGMRRFLALGWRTLGLDLSPADDAAHVLGWPIVEQTADRVVLGARSARFGLDARLISTVGDSRGALGTRIRFDKTLGRVVWRVTRRFHQKITARLVGDAGHKRR